jgi:hypothetical protein
MYASLDALLGTQPFNDWFTPDTTQRQVLGTAIAAVDPYWGWGEFLYVKSNDTLGRGNAAMWDETFTAVLLPNTANQGFPVGFVMGGIFTAGMYGWLQISGLAVYATNATVSADTKIGITAAGVLGTLAAGKEIVNCRNRRAATATVTWTATTYSGLPTIYVPKGYDGAFLGMALSGTGVGASAVVAGLDPDGKRIYAGTAIGTLSGANSTASGSITLTGTYTGYGAGCVQYPFAQGAIT